MDFACRMLASSIGKKVQVAVAGTLLCLFLCSHVAGNLLLWAGPDYFNTYARTLTSSPLILGVEAVLGLIFLLHIVVALRVRWLNYQARPVANQEDSWAGGRTIASASMFWTAMIILVFLIVHLKTMRFDDRGGKELYDHVIGLFQHPAYAAFYLVALIALGLHLSHGAQAAAKTLGLDHPRLTPLIENLGIVFAVVIAVVFMAITVWAGWFSGTPAGAI